MDLTVADLGEKELVKYIQSKTNTILADDTAISKINKSNLISTTDMLIESKHFPKTMTYFQMGFKSVTVNVSDLAAMGAESLGFLLSIAIPKTLKIKYFKEIIDGVLKACNYYNIPLIGGDTNEASEIIINGTALGVADNYLLKNTCSEGDLIAITGKIGLAALGFYSNDPNYLKYTLKPIARIKEGQILKENGATSATDITDGLASELHEMYNGYGMLIYEDKLEITNEYKQLAKSLDLDYLDLVLNFGEDFELVFTIPKEKVDVLKNQLDFIVIGEVTNSSDIKIKLSDGTVKEISKKGYNHFI